MDEVTVLLTFMGSERSNIATTGVTHEKYLPTPGLLRSKSGVSGFYSPVRQNDSPLTRENDSHAQFTPSEMVRAGIISLAGYKTKPRVWLACCTLHLWSQFYRHARNLCQANAFIPSRRL